MMRNMLFYTWAEEWTKWHQSFAQTNPIPMVLSDQQTCYLYPLNILLFDGVFKNTILSVSDTIHIDC